MARIFPRIRSASRVSSREFHAAAFKGAFKKKGKALFPRPAVIAKCTVAGESRTLDKLPGRKERGAYLTRSWSFQGRLATRVNGRMGPWSDPKGLPAEASQGHTVEER